MSSNVYELLISTIDAWDEVDILINLAKNNEENEKIYNAICRSATVLMLSHLEGFIKSLFVNIARDLNDNLTFPDIPKAVKKTYCKQLLGGKDVKNGDIRIQTLTKELERLNGHLNIDIFDFDKNANPKPSTITERCKLFGACNPFEILNQTNLEDIFSQTESESRTDLNIFRKDLLKSIESFPYSLTLITPELDKNKKQDSFWQPFIDGINHKRHLIAHGNTFENHSSPNSLKSDKIKIEFFQCAIINIVCSQIVKDLQK